MKKGEPVKVNWTSEKFTDIHNHTKRKCVFTISILVN